MNLTTGIVYNVSNLKNGLQQNQTTGYPNQRSYVQMSVTGLALLALLIGLLLSFTIFARNRSARTPFNCYIIFILVAEVSLFLSGILFITRLYGGRVVLQPTVCSLYLTFIYLGCSGVQNIELLVAINRLWAFCYPYHYRAHHNSRVALSLCAAVYLTNVAFLLPNIPWSKSTVPMKRCTGHSDANPDYAKLVSFYMSAPLVCLIFSYIILWYKRRNRATGTSRIQPAIAMITTNRQQSVPSLPSPGNGGRRQGSNVRRTRIREDRSNGFVVLTWVVFSTFVFWAPNSIQFVFPRSWRTSSLSGWLFTWSLIGFCVEPWIFLLTIPSLRQKVTAQSSFCPTFVRKN